MEEKIYDAFLNAQRRDAKKKRIDVGTYKSALSSSSSNSNEEESESPKSDPTRDMFMGYDGAVLSPDEDSLLSILL